MGQNITPKRFGPHQHLPSRHALVKWFGVCLAVASGLAVGPEGPMIFIGTGLSHLKLGRNEKLGDTF